MIKNEADGMPDPPHAIPLASELSPAAHESPNLQITPEEHHNPQIPSPGGFNRHLPGGGNVGGNNDEPQSGNNDHPPGNTGTGGNNGGLLPEKEASSGKLDPGSNPASNKPPFNGGAHVNNPSLNDPTRSDDSQSGKNTQDRGGIQNGGENLNMKDNQVGSSGPNGGTNQNGGGTPKDGSQAGSNVSSNNQSPGNSPSTNSAHPGNNSASNKEPLNNADSANKPTPNDATTDPADEVNSGSQAENGASSSSQLPGNETPNNPNSGSNSASNKLPWNNLPPGISDPSQSPADGSRPIGNGGSSRNEEGGQNGGRKDSGDQNDQKSQNGGGINNNNGNDPNVTAVSVALIGTDVISAIQASKNNGNTEAMAFVLPGGSTLQPESMTTLRANDGNAVVVSAGSEGKLVVSTIGAASASTFLALNQISAYVGTSGARVQPGSITTMLAKNGKSVVISAGSAGNVFVSTIGAVSGSTFSVQGQVGASTEGGIVASLIHDFINGGLPIHNDAKPSSISQTSVANPSSTLHSGNGSGRGSTKSSTQTGNRPPTGTRNSKVTSTGGSERLNIGWVVWLLTGAAGILLLL